MIVKLVTASKAAVSVSSFNRVVRGGGGVGEGLKKQLNFNVVRKEDK